VKELVIHRPALSLYSTLAHNAYGGRSLEPMLMNYKRIPLGMNDRASTAIMIYRLEVDSSSRDDVRVRVLQ